MKFSDYKNKLDPLKKEWEVKRYIVETFYVNATTRKEAIESPDALMYGDSSVIKVTAKKVK